MRLHENRKLIFQEISISPETFTSLELQEPPRPEINQVFYDWRKMSNKERLLKLETYLLPNLVLRNWMAPQSVIKKSLTRINRIDCRGQMVQRKQRTTLLGEELFTLGNVFPVVS